jgi:hypothetical protein
VFLAPGLYRIGALMPVNGANQMIAFQSTYQTGAGISLTRFMRQIGSTTLALPDLNMNSSDDVNFGPTFTYTPGPWMPQQPTVVAPNNYTLIGGNGGPHSAGCPSARGSPSCDSGNTPMPPPRFPPIPSPGPITR